MLDKNVFINMDTYKVSVRQAGGILQINDFTVTGYNQKIINERLDQGLEDIFRILSKYNKQIILEEQRVKNKKSSPPNPPDKKQKKEKKQDATTP